MTGARALSKEPPSLLLEPPSLLHLPPATTELLDRRALLDRIDRKFIASRTQLAALLERLPRGYHVLGQLHGQGGAERAEPAVSGVTLRPSVAWARYETCYYDTDGLDAFHEHVRGRRPRYKIRVRKHVDRRKAFLEIKRKNLGERTAKHRIERDFDQEGLTSLELDFIRQHTPFNVERLYPSVWTNFHRATLLGADTDERVTIDIGLVFERNGAVSPEHELVIIELKQPRCSHASPVDRVLREVGVRERSMSKYCAGVAALHESARPRLRELFLKRISRMKRWKSI